MPSENKRDLASTHVLLVEDEPLIALDAEDLLRTLGVPEIVCARSVAEGMSALDSKRFDAALLDLRLGTEFSLPLAQRLASSNVPFGFMTGLRDDSIPDEFRHCPVVAKPFTHQQLTDLLEALIGQK